jgi:hypothetical protein
MKKSNHFKSNRPASRFNIFICIGVTLVCLSIFGVSFIKENTATTIPSSVKPISKDEAREAAEVMARDTLESERFFGDYTAKIYRDHENSRSGSIVIQHKGKVAFFDTGNRFYLGHYGSADEFDPLIPMGQDVTGKGVPNLVVSQYSGGMHCCSKYDVFELGKSLEKITTIDAGHGDTSHFEKRKGVKGLVFVTHDYNFAYWKTCFAESPAPKVILRYCENGYRLADDLMRKPEPSKIKLQQMVTHIRKLEDWKYNSITPLLWGKMLDLIYSGNSSSAYQLFDMAWQPSVPGKDKFLHEFVEQLESSKYWSDIKTMNEGKPVCRQGV